MALYDSESLYLAESQTTLDRLARIEQIIVALETQMIVAAGDANIADYSLNDGQITIRTAYRSPESIAKAITTFEAIYRRLYNRLNGTSVMVLRDARSFNNLSRGWI